MLNLCKNNLHGELPKTLPSLGQLQVTLCQKKTKKQRYPVCVTLLQVLCVGSNSLRGDLNVGGMPIWWNFSDIKTLILDHNFFTVSPLELFICIFGAPPGRCLSMPTLTLPPISGEAARCSECENAKTAAFFHRK